jgi:hypothetical protein
LEGFLQNVSENLKNGGYFIGTCFDSAEVINLLGESNKKEFRSDDELIYSLTKGSNFPESQEEHSWSEGQEITEDTKALEPLMFGKELTVMMESFESEETEYLVNFNYFIEKCKQYKLYLFAGAAVDGEATGTEKDFFLTVSNGYFKQAYSKYLEADPDTPQEILDLSFLNRWFVFKKVDPDLEPELNSEFNSSNMMEDLLAEEDLKDTLDGSPKSKNQKQEPGAVIKLQAAIRRKQAKKIVDQKRKEREEPYLYNPFDKKTVGKAKQLNEDGHPIGLHKEYNKWRTNFLDL